jgi:hypothetical protein
MYRQNILVVSSAENGHKNLIDWKGIAHPFHVDFISNDEQAIESCHLHTYDLIVVDATDASISGKKLKAVLPILQESVTIIFYDGEPVGKISENIEAVFNAKKYKRILNMIMLEPGAKANTNIPQFSLN